MQPSTPLKKVRHHGRLSSFNILGLYRLERHRNGCVKRMSFCFRDPRKVLLNQIALPDLQEHFIYAPYMQFNEKKDRVWSNLMSGSWAWDEAVRVMVNISILFICSLRCARMILFVTIHRREDQYLYRSLQEVTKRWYLLQQGIKNIIRSMLALEIWTIQCDAHIPWVWSQSHFFLFRKVRHQVYRDF